MSDQKALTELTTLAARTRAAQRALGSATAAQRTAALRAIGRILGEREAEILAANARDMAEAADLEAPLRKRLALSAAKLATLRDGLAGLAHSPDPVGRPLRRTELDQGRRPQLARDQRCLDQLRVQLRAWRRGIKGEHFGQPEREGGRAGGRA